MYGGVLGPHQLRRDRSAPRPAAGIKQVRAARAPMTHGESGPREGAQGWDAGRTPRVAARRSCGLALACVIGSAHSPGGQGWGWGPCAARGRAAVMRRPMPRPWMIQIRGKAGHPSVIVQAQETRKGLGRGAERPRCASALARPREAQGPRNRSKKRGEARPAGAGPVPGVSRGTHGGGTHPHAAQRCCAFGVESGKSFGAGAAGANTCIAARAAAAAGAGHVGMCASSAHRLDCAQCGKEGKDAHDLSKAKGCVQRVPGGTSTRRRPRRVVRSCRRERGGGAQRSEKRRALGKLG